jgi:anti-sigma B factor antagonist
MTIRHESPWPERPADSGRPWGQLSSHGPTNPPATPYLRVRQAQTADTLTLAVEGEVDLESSGVLAQAIDEGVHRKPAELVIDLTAVSFLDAAGAGVLIDGRQLASEQRIHYRIAGVPRIARRVLEAIGMYGRLTAR